MSSSPDMPSSDHPATPVSPPSFLFAAYQTDVGLEREHNEDSLFTFATAQETDLGRRSIGLFMVADGMGGHQHGEVASEMVIRQVARQLLQSLPLVPDGLPPQQTYDLLIQQAILHANEQLMAQVQGAGTTLTLVLIIEQEMTLAHIGDSRAYLWTPQAFRQLTTDHSLVARSIAEGVLDPQEADDHPQKNILYRAIGQNSEPEIELTHLTLPMSGAVLLCSDGLWGQVSDADMQVILAAAPTPQTAVATLVDQARQHGGDDNISAILIQMRR